MMYFVAYRFPWWSNNCGNRSFPTFKEYVRFIKQERENWQSYSTGYFVRAPNGISDIVPLPAELLSALV